MKLLTLRKCGLIAGTTRSIAANCGHVTEGGGRSRQNVLISPQNKPVLDHECCDKIGK